MRHHTALRLADGSGWHYVSMSSRGGYPLGHCADHAPHATEDDARACYNTYRRSTIRLDAGLCSWTSCEARPDGHRCPNPAQAYARYGDDGYGQVVLCPAHMTREYVIAAGHLAGLAGDAWVS